MQLIYNIEEETNSVFKINTFSQDQSISKIILYTKKISTMQSDKAKRNPILSGFLSLITPGLGNLYNGQTNNFYKFFIIIIICLNLINLYMHYLHITYVYNLLELHNKNIIFK